MRFAGGAKGMLWCSQVAPGNENALKLRIYGEKGGLEWAQEDPNYLWHSPLGEPRRLITRNGAGATAAGQRVSRIPGGHPEGYLEGFATIYNEAAEAIIAHRGGKPAPEGVIFPASRRAWQASPSSPPASNPPDAAAHGSSSKATTSADTWKMSGVDTILPGTRLCRAVPRWAPNRMLPQGSCETGLKHIATRRIRGRFPTGGSWTSARRNGHSLLRLAPSGPQHCRAMPQ
jgi:hypothetical protein